MEQKEKKLQALRDRACLEGATDAAIIAATDVLVEEQFAERCLEPRCENYGLSKGCPPHVAGPKAFETLLATYEKALFFRIDVPSTMLYSSENRQLFQILHQVTAENEQAAVRYGFIRAQGYAGDSCKRLFCPDDRECQALSVSGSCRFPNLARPSMSGFGVNVGLMLQRLGWEKYMGKLGDAGAGQKLASVCGLVLLY